MKPIKPTRLIQSFITPSKIKHSVLNNNFELNKKSFTSTTPKNPDDPKRILLVEDNEINQRLASVLLTRRGYNVDIAADGLSALDKLEKEHYDLVLMDCHMPHLDGLETTRRIRSPESTSLNPNIHILAMTANVMDIDKANCKQAGMNGFICKPVKKEELYKVIEQTLSQKNS